MNSTKLLSRLHSYLDTQAKKTGDNICSHGSFCIDIEPCSPNDINLESSVAYWSAPERGEFIAGYGICESLLSSGPERLSDLNKQFKKLLNHWNFDLDKNFPIAFGAFSFAENDPMVSPWNEFPNSQLLIPRLIIHIQKGKSRLIVNYKCSENSYRDSDKNLLEEIFGPVSNKILSAQHQQPLGNLIQFNQDWQEQVKDALKNISESEINKLVPSRHIRYKQSQQLPTQELLNRLSSVYPSCNILSIAKGKSRLIAASPERLLKIEGEMVHCDAIGGTLKRSQGQSIVKLMRHNSQSIDKLLNEHAIIVEHIYNILDQFCEVLKLPSAPGIMKLKHLLHLETPVQGRLKKATTVLELAEKLHPTPAVAGYPVQHAKTWLEQHETHQRGLYTGAMGWMSANGSGELSVILRCALLSSNENEHFMDLYAGAGIVENSSPQEEWEETELKLDTILDILK